MRTCMIICTLFAVASLGSNICFADTILVPGEYSTIQEGIEAAVNGDIVLVAAGTYVDSLDFLGKAITVKSEEGFPSTRINGDQSGPVVKFVSLEGADSVLQGFTIALGLSSTVGGGIYCQNSSPTLTDLAVRFNAAEDGGAGIGCIDEASPTISDCYINSNLTQSGGGGGIYCNESSPTIENNVIDQNTAGLFFFDFKGRRENRTRYDEGYGGGIFLDDQSSPLVANNIISNNRAYYGGGIMCRSSNAQMLGNRILNNEVDTGGGGIHIDLCMNAVIEGNFISENFITVGGHGAGIHCYKSTPTIRNNIICHNTNGTVPLYGCYGGGICFSRSSPPINIVNNTLFGNYAEDYGGGIACTNYSYPVVSNSIFWNNSTSNTGGDEIYVGDYQRPAGLTISYSDIDGGLASVLVTSYGLLNWGGGMIDADPEFIDSLTDDFHLTAPSPCCNAGNNSAQFLPDSDFEGDPRIDQDFVDMGADEFSAHFYCTGDFTPGGMITANIIGRPQLNVIGLFFGSGVLDPPLTTAWGDFYLASPWFCIYPLGAMPVSGVMSFTEHIPGSPAAPYDVPIQAFIQDLFSNLFVIEVR